MAVNVERSDAIHKPAGEKEVVVILVFSCKWERWFACDNLSGRRKKWRELEEDQ